ncbi:MAG: TfoX/Sxy family protein [Thermoplasmata archaeon]|jgi:TfoX/Sxy family transcriptional regulator of competence genes|nr:TfoX/Sxy family protein [Thermoplasmata archaeon]
MQMPPASADAVRMFQSLVPDDARVTTRKMFGQPAAFVNGQMFFGVFGGRLFLRLSETDRDAADGVPGFGPFEPMPGRAMHEYRVLPAAVLADRTQARRWISKSLAHVAGLPPKKARPKTR